MTPSPVWIALAALLAGALFATLHLALVDLARAALEEIASLRSRPRASRRVQAILADVPAHARPLGLVRVLCEAVVVLALVAQLALARAAAAPQARDLALGLAIAVPLLWLVNVALASSLAWHVGERAVYSHSHLIRALYLMLTPLRAVARFVDEVVKRLAGVQSSNQSEVLEAELLSVVEEGEREGQLDESEADMIEAVVEFRNLTVEQVMTPRTEVQAFELTNELGAIIRAIRTIGHSRIPVYEGSLDNIVGIFYAKDLMLWLAGDGSRAGPSGTPFDLRSILRPAFFVPETKTVRELLRELLEKKVHIAMVADEYGGTSGLVTIEDIVEEIVGEIRDEY
ncbi:MAG TPA: CNNM domain-containing protein, partial [Phycisphaerales bacterium]|nr:CNNM domain-containing protein [Phycisphaerales bacterium]